MEKEDYFEPRCPLCTDIYNVKDSFEPIPINRVIEKLDSYYEVNDVEGAEKHLLFWLNEATSGKDKRGEFTVRSELMGLYRKKGEKEKALENADRVNELISELNMQDNISSGTAYINIGTVYKAFGYAENSLPFFDNALRIYNKRLKEDDLMFAGLYNNMALSYVDLKNYKRAEEYYKKALKITERGTESLLDNAITLINLASMYEDEQGLKNAKERIDKLMADARKCFDNPKIVRNGYYAFVCNKCAPAFSYYGYEDYANELLKRAKDIYEGN